jgi:hypothetical protein
VAAITATAGRQKLVRHCRAAVIVATKLLNSDL